MAYTMTHILVAERVLEYITPPVDYSTYLIGAIAPDAVHASPHYTPELKEKSHIFADGAVWGEITKEIQFKEWLDNIKKFYINHQDKYDRDFFLGYIVHVLTDICSCRQIYAPFYNSLSKDEMNEKMYQFVQESYSVNFYLFCEYSKDKNLMNILKEGRSYSIAGIYDDKVFEDRIRQLFDFEFKSRDIESIVHNNICTIENTNKFIDDAPQMIKKMFFDDFYIKS